MYAVHEHKVYGKYNKDNEMFSKVLLLMQSNKTVVYAINVAEPRTFIYKAECDVRLIRNTYIFILLSVPRAS